MAERTVCRSPLDLTERKHFKESTLFIFHFSKSDKALYRRGKKETAEKEKIKM